jgi:hypothetical protein
MAWTKESFEASGAPFDYSRLRQATEKVLPVPEDKIDFVNSYF